jgi:hypothetical protein
MAQFPPDLIERFIRDRDQRLKIIAAYSGFDHPWQQKLCELASFNLEWIETWCQNGDAADVL